MLRVERADARGEREPVRAVDGRDRVELHRREPADRLLDVGVARAPVAAGEALRPDDRAADLCEGGGGGRGRHVPLDVSGVACRPGRARHRWTPDEIRQRVRALEPATQEIFYFGCSVGATFGLGSGTVAGRAEGAHALPRPGVLPSTSSRSSRLWPTPGSRRRDRCGRTPRPGRGMGRRRRVPRCARGRRSARRWRRCSSDWSSSRGARASARAGLLSDRKARCGRSRTTRSSTSRRLPPAPSGSTRSVRARRRVEHVGREVVGHLDWAAKHVRFDDELRPTAVYDWDSVTTELEPVVAGQAAASFTYTEELDHPVARWPTPDESRAFLADYERPRGAAFDTGGASNGRRSLRVPARVCGAVPSRGRRGPRRTFNSRQHADVFL